MKRIVVAACLFLAVAAARPVEAADFTITSLQVSLRDFDPGLVLWHSGLIDNAVNLPTVGSTDTIDLFTIGTDEQAFNWGDDLAQYAIKVAIGLSPHAFSGTVEGLTGALFLGYVTWNDPITVAFGPNNAGLLQIALSDAVFSLPGEATVKATFKLLSDVPGGTRQVPEPGTLALLGVAAAAVALRHRRRQA